MYSTDSVIGKDKLSTVTHNTASRAPTTQTGYTKGSHIQPGQLYTPVDCTAFGELLHGDKLIRTTHSGLMCGTNRHFRKTHTKHQNDCQC